MNIGYFADGPWSHKSFEKLIIKDKIKISFICARFDKNDQVLKDYASNYNIPFLTHRNINSDDFLSLDYVKECDLFISMSFNQIFKCKTFDLPRLGTINCHAGKLPSYRGRNILNWVLINDENEFGITVHFVDEGIDTGDIIKQAILPISDSDDYSTLLDRAYVGCANLLSEAVDQFLEDNVVRVPQKTICRYGSYCSGREVGDEIINWNQTSRDIFNFVRAICYPGPKARTFIDGKELKINRVEFITDAPKCKGIPGAVISKNKDELLVKTQDSYVKLTEWECAKTLKVGDRLSND